MDYSGVLGRRGRDCERLLTHAGHLRHWRVGFRSADPQPQPITGSQNWASLDLVQLPEDRGGVQRAWDWTELNDTLYRT